MSQAQNPELIDRFDQFYRNYYRDAIGQLAQQYPTDQRSLHIDWHDLYRFDPDLADDYLEQPDHTTTIAHDALRLYDLPIDVSLDHAHVRIHNLPEHTEIRDIRAHNVNTLVSIQGIIRKATNVRPKLLEAAFECQRCGTHNTIPQTTGYQEPHQCQGCERQGPFTINHDHSTFVDAQKLRVQESPEGLRGGETPQSIDVNIEDDITGTATPGDHVTITGTLRIKQQARHNEKTRLFDVYMEGHSLTLEDEEFENMDITADDKHAIIELSTYHDIYDLVATSIAPSIYGFEEEKLAMALQLFSGVTKHLPDNSRIRGDLHILLIGDPGTGKCICGDSLVGLSDGRQVPIRDLVEKHLSDPKPVDDGVYQEVDFTVPSLQHDGRMAHQRATKVWKREAPEFLYRIRTAHGKTLKVTPSHPLFVQDAGRFKPVRAENLSSGDFIAVPRRLNSKSDDTLDIPYRRSKSHNAVRVKLPTEWTPSLARLIGYLIGEGHVRQPQQHGGDARVTNADEEILQDVVAAFEDLQLPYAIDPLRSSTPAKAVRCNSGEFVSFLKNLEPTLLDLSGNRRVPDAIFQASRGVKREFLRAYVDGEGTVSPKEREITVGSMSRELLEGVQTLLLWFGVSSQLKPRAGGSYRLRISGEDALAFAREIGFVTRRKTDALGWYEEVEGNTNTDVIPVEGDELRRIREALALTQFDLGIPRTTYQHYERGDRNPSRESLRRVVRAFEERVAFLKEAQERLNGDTWSTVVDLRGEMKLSQAVVAEAVGVEQTMVSYHERNDTAPDRYGVGCAGWLLWKTIDQALFVEEDIERLRRLVESDIAWDRIESIEPIMPEYEWVYDLEVAGTHNYIANGVVSHNSQLLQYIRHISPRSVYTSGKGSTSAGLTASAVRDDFGDGQTWSLEAGALVLADKGIAAVDELDKMRCVTGDTLVRLGDGGVERIGEMAEEAATQGVVEELANGRTIRGVDREVWTMTDDRRLVRRPVTAVHEYDAPSELARVTLESGESVTTTPDHPFIVAAAGESVEKPAEALQPGDEVFVPGGPITTLSDGGRGLAGRTGGGALASAVALRRVTTVESVTPDPSTDAKVYDLSVQGTRNYVANGIIIHNSEDRSAMHEALEQQQISVSKAGINATLKSRCSLLGAANPKYGRFDQYEPIAEQIELEPALISRFDLIFTVTDQPDEEGDRELADHILRTNYAGELGRRLEKLPASGVSREELERAAATADPPVEPEVFRKYIAYAKRNVFPAMSDEAREAIRDFYVELRSLGVEENSPVPVTARKLEALVRLAEASARVRLSDTVTREDAERVIGIVRASLRDIGVDPETGRFDADVIEVGTSQSQRERIKTVRALIQEIEGEHEDGAPVDEVVARAVDAGMDEAKVEHEIEKLKQKGEVYEPRSNHLRTT